MKTRLLGALLAVFLFLMPNLSFGQSPPLGATASFALFTATGALNNTGASMVTGDIGSNSDPITGFPDPGTVVGVSHSANPTTVQAATDVAVLYGYLAAVTCGQVHAVLLGNETLNPNVYCLGGASTLDGVLTLDGLGNSDAMFIFKIDGALSTTAYASVVLINGASLCNVYWQINGKLELGNNTVFRGNVVTNGAISFLDASSLYGRGLSQGGAITLQNNIVTKGGTVAASVITAGSATTFCTGGSVVLSGNVGGTWSTGATTASITVTTAGIYSVTNTSSCGTAVSNTITVVVNPVATASVITAGGALALCSGNTVTLSGNVGGTWSSGETTASITVSAAGNYSVTNTNGCGSVTSNHIIVTTGTAPAASTITAGGVTTFCAGNNVVLSGNVGGTWSTGASSATLTVTATGDYYVTNTNTCGSATSNHIAVVVNPLPVASVITAGSATTFCEGGSVVLSGNVDGTWSTGATTASITVTTAGAYSVTNTNSCGSAVSNTISVVISPVATASVITAGGAVTFCAGGSVVLSGNVGGNWSTGATSATLTVTATGDYYVTNTNTCGSVTSNHIAVTVNPLPTASVITAGSAIALCGSETVTLSGNAGGKWSTIDTTATITVSIAGDYFVNNTNGCGSVTSNHIVVTTSVIPTASVITAGGATTICAGENVVLSGNVSGTWSTGATTATLTVTATGDYYTTNTNSCGTVTSNHISVTVNPLAVAAVISAGGATTFCAGNELVLSGNIDGIWSNGATTPTITVTASGDYSVKNTNSCSIATSNHIIVTVTPLATASVITAGVNATTFCEGENVVLSGNVDGTWNTGEVAATLTVTAGGDYFVTNTNTCGSVTSNHISVTVNPLATASVIAAVGATTFCEGESVVLSGNVDGAWSTGERTATLTVSVAGDYFVTNTNSCGGVNSNHIIVTVNPEPSMPSNQAACVGSSVNFSVGASESGLTYQWRRGTVDLTDGGNISGATSATLTLASLSLSDAGSDYNVVINGGCAPYAASINVSLTVNAGANILGEPYNQTACLGGCEESFLVVATGSGLTYQWRRGTVNLTDGGNISGATTGRLTFSPVNLSDTAYNYNVVVSGNCGSAISVDVSLLICNVTGIKSYNAGNLTEAVNIYPNPFTSTINVEIKSDSQVSACELKLYNVLGEEVLIKTVRKPLTVIETNNLPMGAYFYKINVNNKTIQSGKLISLQ
jgi:hypothetical protein